MTIEELKEFFINAHRFERKTGMASNSFRNWMKWGFIPIESQCRIERFTASQLKANYEHARKNVD